MPIVEGTIRAPKKKSKAVPILISSLICAAVLFVILLFTVWIPNQKYKEALAFAEAGDLDHAQAVFLELGSYKDAREQYKKHQWAAGERGDIVFLGTYEQDNKSDNGPEEIEWFILSKEEDRVLLISRNCLDTVPYNVEWTDKVTWESCSLRAWLNNEFLNGSFTAEEQAKLIPTVNVNPDNEEYDVDCGEDTTDRVFLLSVDEAETYALTGPALQAYGTVYAKEHHLWLNKDNDLPWWWLRSPGCKSDRAAYYTSECAVENYGLAVGSEYGGIRPAIWVKLN